MVFCVSFIFASLIVLIGDKAMKKAPQVFYICAAVLALFFAIFDFKEANKFVKDYIIGMFTNGTLATAFFVIVMFAGALKNGSALIKKLMPIRAQLSIIASILILAHGFNYGKIYVVRLFKAPDSMTAINVVFVIFSLIMIAIMIPLAVISFKKIRSKMNGKRWKKIQRAAYVFYGLIYLHVLLIYLPSAQKGNVEKIVNIIIYSIVFISYAVMRVRKAVLKRNKDSAKAVSVSGAVVMAAVCALVFVPYGQSMKEASEAVAYSNVTSSLEHTADTSAAVYEENGGESSEIKDVSENEQANDKSSDTSDSVNSKSDSKKKSSDSSKNNASSKSSSSAVSSTGKSANSSEKENKKTNSENDSSKSSSGDENTSSKTTSSKSNTSSKTTSSKSNTSSKTTSSKSNTSSNTTSSQANTSSTVSTVSVSPVTSRIEAESVREPEVSEEPVEEPIEEPIVQSKYRDGVYKAKTLNYEYDLFVTITIENDRIVDLQVEAEEDDMWYFDRAKEVIVPQILEKQSTEDIDAVSESTISSDAIKKAVNEALKQAEN